MTKRKLTNQERELRELIVEQAREALMDSIRTEKIVKRNTERFTGAKDLMAAHWENMLNAHGECVNNAFEATLLVENGVMDTAAIIDMFETRNHI